MELVRDFPRRFISSDLKRSIVFSAVADGFVRTYDGPSQFVRDLRRVLLDGPRRSLSVFQLTAALNVLRDDLRQHDRREGGAK